MKRARRWAVLAGVLLLVAVLVRAGVRAPHHPSAAGGSSGVTPGAPAHPSRSAARSAPSTAGFPNRSTTGVPAGTALKAVPGSVSSGAGWRWNGSGVQVTAGGTVLSGLDINGPVYNRFAHLRIRDSKVRCTGEKDWCLTLGAGSSVLHTEIGGGADGTTFSTAIGVWTGGPDNVLDAVDVHHTSDGLRVDGGTTVRDSYIHDLVNGQFDGVHSDGSQSTAAGGPVVFDHNTIVGGNNDCIFIQASHAVTITDNLLLVGTGSSGRTSYGIGGGGAPVLGPITIANNVFGRGWQGGPIRNDRWPDNSAMTGNVYRDGSPA